MFVPMPPSAEAALAGATVLNLSGSPITIGRAGDRRLLARSASAQSVLAAMSMPPGRESTLDGLGRSDDDLGEWRTRRSERFPKGVRRSVADVR